MTHYKTNAIEVFRKYLAKEISLDEFRKTKIVNESVGQYVTIDHGEMSEEECLAIEKKTKALNFAQRIWAWILELFCYNRS